ncbi:NAD-binding protein [Streptomyces viridiviolaceus]
MVMRSPSASAPDAHDAEISACGPCRKALIIGDQEVARRTCAALTRQDLEVVHLAAPTDDELRSAMAEHADAVAILVRNDVVALRYALLIEHLQHGIQLIVTLFDRTVADQIVQAIPNCHVSSPADISVPSIIGACLGPEILALHRTEASTTTVLQTGERVHVRRFERAHDRLHTLRSYLRGHLRPTDVATRIMLIGLAGLATVLACDSTLATLVLHEPAAQALYAATRVVATVGPGPASDKAPTWYLIFSTIAMHVTIGFTAIFTAGVVDRLLSASTVGLIGPRALPTRGHVVVGLGQVGLRLCIELKRLGLPVVAIERNPSATNLRLARAQRIPVLIAHAEDRSILEKLSLGRARALAAMSTEDLDNLEVAIAALAVAPDLRVVIRAGDRRRNRREPLPVPYRPCHRRRGPDRLRRISLVPRPRPRTRLLSPRTPHRRASQPASSKHGRPRHPLPMQRWTPFTSPRTRTLKPTGPDPPEGLAAEPRRE